MVTTATEGQHVITMFQEIGIPIYEEPAAIIPDDIPAVDFYFEKNTLSAEENEKYLERFIISNTEEGWTVIGKYGDMPLSTKAALSPLGELMRVLEVGFEHIVRIN